MRAILWLVAFLVFPASGAFAQDCQSGDTYSFAAETERGWPGPPGILVKLKRERCGFEAVILPKELIAQGSNGSCKFGQIIHVSGTRTGTMPDGTPLSGSRYLVAVTMRC
jgi:hypothetical protein